MLRQDVRMYDRKKIWRAGSGVLIDTAVEVEHGDRVGSNAPRQARRFSSWLVHEERFIM